MHIPLTTLISNLDSPDLSKTNVIQWGSPVPSFGNLKRSRVATLGLNPSNREFVDKSGRELKGKARRFHTLNSLGIEKWDETNSQHLRLILESCNSYFRGNPYDIWFKKLDKVVEATQTSYYDESSQACHLDLIPYATNCKWTKLTAQERTLLVTVSGNSLALLLRDSQVQILILNGASVIDQFEKVTGVCLCRREMPEWSLQRRSVPSVKGYSYKGEVDNLSGLDLDRCIMVLGFNHNLQSSFGVTTKVIKAINNWIARTSHEVLL